SYNVAEVVQSGWTPTFTTLTPVNVAGSADPTDMAIADINTDGNLDALIVVPGSKAVVRMINDGTGVFTRMSLTTPVNVGGQPVAIAVGDFDGLNGPDFATANLNGNSISIRLNDGSGVFSAAASISFALNSDPRVVSAGRFSTNNDADLDLFASLALDNRWEVHANDGSGSFSPNINATTAFVDFARDSIVADFDGDTRDDVAVVYANTDNVEIEFGGPTGLGSGTTPFQRVDVGDIPAGIAVADFDGNGQMDFVTANKNSLDVTVVLNQGGAIFDAGVAYSAGLSPVHVATGDFNRDGSPDIAVANRDGNTVSLVMNRGNGTFAAPIPFGVGTGPETVGVADINGDGVDDLLVVNKTARTLSALVNAGNQTVNVGTGQSLTVDIGNRQFQ
ncbi:MAG: FG-GAP repeat domain-containing protein, partial [Pirellulales bacterium]